MEVDIVAESLDKSTVLIGEVKWSDKTTLHQLENTLNTKCLNIPFLDNRKIIKAAFVKQQIGKPVHNTVVFTPKEVIRLL